MKNAIIISLVVAGLFYFLWNNRNALNPFTVGLDNNPLKVKNVDSKNIMLDVKFKINNSLPNEIVLPDIDIVANHNGKETGFTTVQNLKIKPGSGSYTLPVKIGLQNLGDIINGALTSKNVLINLELSTTFKIAGKTFNPDYLFTIDVKQILRNYVAGKL